jgi:hypothetical protein
MGPLCSQFGFLFFYQAERLILPLSLKNLGYPLKAGQNACVDVAVGWANGFIVNPTLMPSSVGCEKMQPNLYLNVVLDDWVISGVAWI